MSFADDGAIDYVDVTYTRFLGSSVGLQQEKHEEPGVHDAYPLIWISRDKKGQPILDLAQATRQSCWLQDRDLLALAGRTKFLIESPESYRRRALSA